MKKLIKICIILTSVSVVILLNKPVNHYIYVPFKKSMENTDSIFKEKYSDKKNLMLLNKMEKLYEKNNLLKSESSIQPRIPKIIHQIWIGSNPLPEFYKNLIKTWKNKHPTWKYILWTDQEVEKFDLKNKNAYLNAKKMSEKANILRLEILDRIGGVYIDTDFECLKPLDELNHHYDFYIGIGPNQNLSVILNGLIGSIPNHPFIKFCIQQMTYESSTNVNKHQFEKNGILFISRMMSIYNFNSSNLKNIALPMSYFYPISGISSEKNPIEYVIKPESFGIHYWGNTLHKKEKLYQDIKKTTKNII